MKMEKYKNTYSTNNNKKQIEHDNVFYNNQFEVAEFYQIEANKHKYKPGDILELHGMEQYPQFNGETVQITTYRKDGMDGKAYYFKTKNKELSDNLNWIYEHRFRPTITKKEEI